MLTYLIVRCHGLRTRLLPPHEIEGLAKLKDIKDIATALLKTDYRENIERLEVVGAKGLERTINEKLVERYRFVVELAPGDIQDFLRIYSRKFEVQNIMRILRGKALRSSPAYIKEGLLPLGDLSDLKFEHMAERESLEEVIGALGNTPYEEVAGSLRWHREYDSLLPLEMHLKKIYYTSLLNALHKVPLVDRDRLRRLIGSELDITNCFTCVAPIVHGYDKEFVKNLLIPHSLRISLSAIESVIEASDLNVVKRCLSPYAEIVKHLLEGEDILAQTEALKHIRREVMREAFVASTSFTYVICYLTLCEIERRDLSIIVLGRQYNVRPEEVLELLASKA